MDKLSQKSQKAGAIVVGVRALAISFTHYFYGHSKTINEIPTTRSVEVIYSNT